MQYFTLRNICSCTAEQQRQLLDIRNSDAVRRSMYTEHLISFEEHLGYVDRLRQDTSQRIFLLITAEGKAVGMAGVSRIDYLHRKCDWAFYLSTDARGGIGSAIEVFMLDYIMDALGMEKLNCEVIETNVVVVNMHRKFGFVEEGFRRSNVEKDGVRIGVHFLGITRAEWKAAREGVMNRIGARIANIQIAIAPDITN